MRIAAFRGRSEPFQEPDQTNRRNPHPGPTAVEIKGRKVWSPGFSRQSVTFVQRAEMVASIDNSHAWPAEAGTPNPTAVP